MTSGGGSGFLHLSSMPSGMSLGVGEVGLEMGPAPEDEARPAPGMAVDDRAGGGDEDEDEDEGAPGTGGLGPATGTGEVVRCASGVLRRRRTRAKCHALVGMITKEEGRKGERQTAV